MIRRSGKRFHDVVGKANSSMVLAIDPLVRSRDLLEGVLVSLKVHPFMPL